MFTSDDSVSNLARIFGRKTRFQNINCIVLGWAETLSALQLPSGALCTRHADSAILDCWINLGFSLLATSYSSVLSLCAVQWLMRAWQRVCISSRLLSMVSERATFPGPRLWRKQCRNRRSVSNQSFFEASEFHFMIKRYAEAHAWGSPNIKSPVFFLAEWAIGPLQEDQRQSRRWSLATEFGRIVAFPSSLLLQLCPDKEGPSETSSCTTIWKSLLQIFVTFLCLAEQGYIFIAQEQA